LLKRTHTCGEITADLDHQIVTINGWVDRVRNLGGVLFVTVRDRYGKIQVLFRPDDDALFSCAASLRGEDVVAVCGRVTRRPDTAIKEDTGGAVEIIAEKFEVLSKALTPPFYIHIESDVNEELRLTYRYLDLRRQRMQKNIQLRHQVVQAVRAYFNEHSFLEIETPILTKSTPEGARDFLVPSRLKPGKFYALPQSPQLFKQLLMVSGFDRYYQIARCFRDEDFRADRQPEFTQIDYEMSFVEQQDIMRVTEGILKTVFKNVLGITIPTPFTVMEYEAAMDLYGTDKPDLRYGLTFTDVTDICKDSAFEPVRNAIQNGGVLKGFRVPGAAPRYSRKMIEEMETLVKKAGAKGLLHAKTAKNPETGSALLLKTNFDKHLSPSEAENLIKAFALEENDLLFMVSGEKKTVNVALGVLRSEIAKRESLIPKDQFCFLWVVNFPMFSYSEEEQRFVAEHHPFTMPDLTELETHKNSDATKIHAHAYDVVLNGWEIGGGSVRIHSREVQKTVFSLLGIDESSQKSKFGFLLDAFQYGVPPHAGCAMGLDRLVAIIAGEEYIRDVIPFPKTTSGICQMTAAPSDVENEQLEKLSLKLIKDAR